MDLWRSEQTMDYLDGVRRYEALKRINRRSNAITAVSYVVMAVCVTALCWWLW